MFFSVDDKYKYLIESVLCAISKDDEPDAFAFGLTYKNGKYATGYSNCSPTEQMCISGYLSLEANRRYLEMNYPTVICEDNEAEWIEGIDD